MNCTIQMFIGMCSQINQTEEENLGFHDLKCTYTLHCTVQAKTTGKYSIVVKIYKVKYKTIMQEPDNSGKQTAARNRPALHC